MIDYQAHIRKSAETYATAYGVTFDDAIRDLGYYIRHGIFFPLKNNHKTGIMFVKR